VTTARRARRIRQARRALPLLLLAAALLVAVAVAGGDDRRWPPLDPRSTAADGTKGTVDTLRELGAVVDVTGGLPSAGTDTALLLVDDLDDARREALRGWIRSGGTLVVTDPTSLFAPEVSAFKYLPVVRMGIARRCELPALAGVERISAPIGIGYEPAPDEVGCFPSFGGHWLVSGPLGRGTVVALGGSEPLRNDLLGEADNAPLVAALLLPRPGARVAFLRPPAPGSGDASLGELVPMRVRLALLQLGVAFAVVVLWRARRLGRPVSEQQPVAIAGSELVVAVGQLLQHAGARERAAGLLRDDLRRGLAERLGMPAGATAEQVSAAAGAHRRASPEALAGLLAGPVPRSEGQLLTLARGLEDARREVLARGSGSAAGTRLNGAPASPPEGGTRAR
jgi:hypothetical protein